ncbi:MAG: glucose 1-dehydrogenase [Thermoplasmatales archaeon]
MSISGKLNGKTAIVTGASGGIGAKIAERFAREGCRVAIIFRNSWDDAENLLKHIEADGGSAALFRCDVSRKNEVDRVVNDILSEFGRVDVLVNNAGRMILGDPLSMSIDLLKEMMETNVYSILYFVQALSKQFKTNGGSIINIGSNAGIGTALEGYTYYSVTKAAVIALTRRLSFDFRGYGVRVNCIAPGTIDTALVRGGKTDAEIEEMFNTRSKNSVLGRVGNPDEIASVALFLATDDSSFVTGQTITVDGGRFDYLSHGQ